MVPCYVHVYTVHEHVIAPVCIKQGMYCVCTWLLVLNIKAPATSDGGGEVVLPKSGTAEWEKRALINLTIVVS